MLNGLNDRENEAQELGQLLQGKLAHVNLIPWNVVDHVAFKKSEIKTMKQFQKILEGYGIPSTIRVSLGEDISAACGQLAKQRVLNSE